MSHILATARNCSIFTFPLSVVIMWKFVLYLFHLPSSFLYFSVPHTKAGLYLSRVDNFCIFVLVNDNKSEVLTKLI